MKHKTYRICLLSLVIIAVIGGILYYTNENGNKSTKGEGTFVTKFVEGCHFHEQSADKSLY